MHSKKNYNNKSVFPIQGLRPMSKSLPRGLKTILKKGGYNYASIINNWSDLVGKQISNVCYPKSLKTGRGLKDGILFLNVFHGDQIEVEYSKKDIMDKINVFFGYIFIKEIRLVLIKEKITKKIKYNFSKEEKSKFQRTVDKINNANLKKNLTDLLNVYNKKK